MLQLCRPLTGTQIKDFHTIKRLPFFSQRIYDYSSLLSKVTKSIQLKPSTDMMFLCSSPEEIKQVLGSFQLHLTAEQSSKSTFAWLTGHQHITEGSWLANHWRKNLRRVLLDRTKDGPFSPASWITQWPQSCSWKGTEAGGKVSRLPLLLLLPPLTSQQLLFTDTQPLGMEVPSSHPIGMTLDPWNYPIFVGMPVVSSTVIEIQQVNCTEKKPSPLVCFEISAEQFHGVVSSNGKGREKVLPVIHFVYTMQCFIALYHSCFRNLFSYPKSSTPLTKMALLTLVTFYYIPSSSAVILLRQLSKCGLTIDL